MKNIILCVFLLLSPLLSANTLNLTTVNWEPFYGEGLKENGFFAAISREAFKRAGYDITVKFLPWKRALESARSGKFDGLLGAYYTDDRAKTFYYSDVVHQNDEVFVSVKDRGISYTQLNQLKQYKVGGMRGSAQMDELRSLGFDIEETTDNIKSLLKLSSHRLDMVLIGRQQFNYLLQNENELRSLQGNLEAIEPPFKSFNLYCTITKKRKDGDEIISGFNQALSQMRNDGTFQAILKRFGQ